MLFRCFVPVTEEIEKDDKSSRETQSPHSPRTKNYREQIKAFDEKARQFAEPKQKSLADLAKTAELITKLNPLTIQDLEVLSSTYQLILSSDQSDKTRYQNKSDDCHRLLAIKYLTQAEMLQVVHQQKAAQHFHKAEVALEKIKEKTEDDRYKIHQCQAAQAKYSQSCYALMFHIISGGTVPDEVREKFLAIDDSKFNI